MLDIIYRDNHLIAINKPHGLLVHRTNLAKDADQFALQLLRDQIDAHVFPVHRLDRKTSGVLLFALNKDCLKTMQSQFAENQIKKSYLAIVRGYTDEYGTIDYPLRKENGKLQEAITNYRTLSHGEINQPFNGHPTSRYSLLKVAPVTGRMHQIRKHLSHIYHPIIGDRPHGCNKQNKLFKEKWQMTTMLLHALQIECLHPISNAPIIIKCNPHSEFDRMCEVLGFGDEGIINT